MTNLATLEAIHEKEGNQGPRRAFIAGGAVRLSQGKRVAVCGAWDGCEAEIAAVYPICKTWAEFSNAP